MKKITTMDKAALKVINGEVDKALQKVAASLGLTVEVAGGSYSSGEFKPRVAFKVDGADKAEFARCAYLIGLDAEDYGREFVSRGRTFKITGINLRAPKYPVDAQCLDDGKAYRFPEATVQAALKVQVQS